MKPLLRLGTVMLIALAAKVGWARQTLNIDYFADTGRSTTIFLKNEIMRKYPYIQLHDKELVKVIAEARSRRGYGSIELMVSGRSQDIEGVGSRLEMVELNNYARFDHGTWQLRVDGEVYIGRITVVIEDSWNGGGGYPPGPRPPAPGPGPRPPVPPDPGLGRSVSLGVGEADGYFERDSDFFSGRLLDVSSIQIQALDDGLQLRQVVAIYGNGQRMRLTSLEGYLNRGQTLRAYVNLRDLRQIRVTAMSTSRFGRARYEVVAFAR